MKRYKTTADDALTLVPLQPETAQIVLFTDASFLNALRSKTQLGFVLLLEDGNYNANAINYGSSR